ncbi:MAG: fluoride efflux transporter CrcB [Neisseria animaloris]|uniref:fluoride efflux transporter CrcB n=1 Tax=Neisseria animaloris TaxID=326522 RepID=UPI000D38B775|nr:fluoride efflux transporter CrcB [Neisseria animaloris]MDO5073558.1 fluoride efflux transporter CrcB [Neisseria animaloris]
MLNNLSAIIIGAAFGAVLRWALGLWFAHTLSWAAFGTLAANWLGAYIIGVAAAVSELFPALSPHWRLLLITGFLGSLTTFSGFSLEVVGMLQMQRWGAAAATSSLHLFGSLLLTVLGMTTVQMFR